MAAFFGTAQFFVMAALLVITTISVIAMTFVAPVVPPCVVGVIWLPIGRNARVTRLSVCRAIVLPVVTRRFRLTIVFNGRWRRLICIARLWLAVWSRLVLCLYRWLFTWFICGWNNRWRRRECGCWRRR